MSKSLKLACALLIVAGGGAGLALAQSAGKKGDKPAAATTTTRSGKTTDTKAAAPGAASAPAAAPASAAAPAATSPAPDAAPTAAFAPRHYDIGREAKPEEIAGWDIDISPDGKGLPPGKGTARRGEELYVEQCAVCHGEFGESAGRWPILAGGAGTLASHDPVKSIGSYWPYASTVIDYIRRAMPYGNAQSLSGDDLYSIVAYVLYLNDVITDQNFELSDKNFSSIKLPNQPNFYDDDRETAEQAFWKKEPCMKDCVAGTAKITGRARAIDVTPEEGQGPRVE
ncbi:MAG: cytochrome c [Xanthobacteraceae bacterium]